MYRVLYNDALLFDPYVEETAITDAKLTQEVNSSAYFDFTISPKHPLYDTVAEREGAVKLYYDAEKLFEGEITKIETDIYGYKAITCVSALDYLNDTCVRPYSTVKSEGLELVPPSSVNGYFQWLIDQHNEHVLDASKTFTVGVNQGEYFTGGAFIYRSSESYSSTADEIQSNILDVFGGYLFLRYDGENAVLDLYSDVHETNAQIIDFGVNITDFSKILDTDEQYTALIVQGGSPEFQNGGFEDGTFIEWASYARGNISSDQVHSGSYSAYFTEGGNYINDTGFYFKTGARYKSTIWVKNERDADIIVTGAYQHETTSDGWKTKTVSGASLSVPNDGEWHEFTFDFLPDVQPQTKIRPVWSFGSLTVESNHRVYVDDAEFTRLDGEDSVSEDPLDLSHIPDGVTSYDSDVVKKGDVLYSTSYVQRYGYKEKVYSDDTITDEQKLLEEGIKQLRKLMAPVVTIDVKAVDLSLYIQGYTHLRIGEAVRVRSAVHDVDEYLMVSSIDLDLQDPGQTDYTLGTSYDTLTGQQSGYLKSLNAGINHSLDSVASIDQTVKDQAVQIGSVEQIANDAKDTADNAQQAAQDAQNSASSALDKAEAVEGAVNEIQGMIDDINSGAEQAKQDAAQAKADAQQAAAKADAAAEKADSYQQQITDVTTTVNGVVQEVEGYTAQISGAVEDAGAALSAVTSLEADVDGFKTSVSQTYQTKRDAAEQMAQEVLDRNSAIKQSASEITQSVSETYQVKGDYLTEGQAAEVYASKAELSTTADAITATVEEKFDDSLLVKEADGGVVDCGDTAGMPLAGLTVYGQTRQNLWTNPDEGTNKGCTVTSNDNGSFTLSGTNASESVAYLDTPFNYSLRPGGTYTLSFSGTATLPANVRIVLRENDSDLGQIALHNLTASTNSITFTTASNLAFCSAYVRVPSGATVSGTYRVMLNEGSEAEPWCPPGLNSVNSVEVVQSGKNLLDYERIKTYQIISAVPKDDGLHITHTNPWGGAGIVFDPWFPAGSYIVSCVGVSGARMISSIQFSSTWTWNATYNSYQGCAYYADLVDTRTITADEPFRFGFIFPVESSDKAYPLQLELGSTATEYEPPNVTSTPIPLLGNKISSLPDGTRDELTVDVGGNVVLRKKTASIVTSTNNGVNGTPSDEGRDYWRCNIIHGSMMIPGTQDFSNGYCDKFDVDKNAQNGTISILASALSIGQVSVYVPKDISSTASAAKTLVEGRRPFELVYTPNTVKTIPLGRIDLPALPEQNAHVWISTGTPGLDPDIHATWYGENASALKDFASKAELKVESDQIKATVEETYSTKEEVSAVEDKADAAQDALDSYKNTVSTTYATKSEVTQTASSIKSEVSETYTTKEEFNGLEVGGRNLLYDTKDMTVKKVAGNAQRYYTTYINTVGTGGGLVRTSDGIKLTFGAKTNVSIQAPLASFGNVENNETVTLSFTYRGNITSFGTWFFLQQTEPNVSLWGFPGLNADGQWHEYKHTFSSPDANIRTCVSVLMFYNLPGYDKTKWVEIKEGTLKLEKGDKATDWSPAPEDMLSTADASATYATKTSLSTVEQTVDGLKSTVSSNYTTLNNKFGSYYTKTEVDQKDNSIKSTVSSVQTTASNALEKASTVEQTAEGLVVRLTQAEKDVDTAQSTANTAKSTASTANTTANAAKTAATNAQTAANNAAKTATNYLKFDSSGLCVGNMTASTLSYNTLIKSTGVDIRNGTTVLATYGSSAIELGKNSKSSVIQFSNNQGFLRATGKRSIQIGSGTPSSMGGALTFGDTDGSALFNGSLIGKYGSFNYEMYAGRVIFSGTATTGNVTLLESAANFDYITIFVRTNDNYYGSTTVWAPNGKNVALSVAFTNNASAGGAGMYIKTRTVSISGTAIANVNYGYGTTRHDAYCTAAYGNSYIYIYQVVGYK